MAQDRRIRNSRNKRLRLSNLASSALHCLGMDGFCPQGGVVKQTLSWPFPHGAGPCCHRPLPPSMPTGTSPSHGLSHGLGLLDLRQALPCWRQSCSQPRVQQNQLGDSFNEMPGSHPQSFFTQCRPNNLHVERVPKWYRRYWSRDGTLRTSDAGLRVGWVGRRWRWARSSRPPWPWVSDWSPCQKLACDQWSAGSDEYFIFFPPIIKIVSCIAWDWKEFF